MHLRGKLLFGLASCGIIVALYALHIEAELERDPFYEPACNTRWGSCSAVFSSEYARPLSKWGLVPSGSALDLSLPVAGIANYGLYLFYPTRLGSLLPVPETTMLAISFASVLFSLYLLYVLKFILQDFCIVCTTFHVINFSTFFFVALPDYLRPGIHPRPGKSD
mmetsp:Transcript_28853/g.64520  ORF Transcript_28853/g.64520 Transcript_28853/m.64520 type:complete len:165 (+) Transcript_28853:94-588(+)